MHKIMILIFIMVINVLSVSAAKFPEEISRYIKNEFPKAEIRFDGLVIIDNVLYLPVYPAKVINPQTIEIKKTAPSGKTLKNLPDIVVFNNDFSLLKVVVGKDGKRRVFHQVNPFEEVKTGLLPQDLLVPKGLIIPENIRTIIGGLRIATEQDQGLKIRSEFVEEQIIDASVKNDLVESVSQLKDKNLFVITCKSKNIHVIPIHKTAPDYALAMNSLPADIKSYKDKFLLVSMFDTPELDVISLADASVIKKFDLDAQAERIIIDNKNNKAYVAVPETSSIYVIDLPTMNLKQKVQVNGRCEKMYLTEDSSKLIYVDKNTNDVWAVELNNGFEIKEIGIFPNISSLVYAQNKVYLASRTRNSLAIIDYATLSEYAEVKLEKKPTDMLLYGKYLYILSAEDSILQILNTETDEMIANVKLDPTSFTTKITRVPNTSLALITGAIQGKYYVVNLDKRQVISTMQVDVPINNIVITGKIKR